MTRALLKKQFRELFASWFVDKKTGARRSGWKTAGTILLFVSLLLVVAVAFGFMGMLLAEAMVPVGLGWLYFAFMGLIALAMGVIGSVFNTYAGLYQARDNDLLLSMPIPPARLLLVRMTGVYAMSLLYTGMVYLPAMVVYAMVARASFGEIFASLLAFFFLSMVVLALTCALGYVVAQAAGRLRHRKITTVLLSLVLLGVYYFCYFQLSSALQYLAENAAEVGANLQNSRLLHVFGTAAAGDWGALLLLGLVSLGVFALTLWVMSKSFVALATANRGEKKKAAGVLVRKPRRPEVALLLREGKRFFGSPVYMLNGGLGLFLMPLCAVILLWKGADLLGAVDMLTTFAPWLTAALPGLGAGSVCLLTTMNMITPASISMEGRQLWVLRTAPVAAEAILLSKVHLHLLLTGVPALLCLGCLWWVLKLPFVCLLPALGLVLAFLYAWGIGGLLLDLRRPNLTWISEVVPVKQNLSSLFTLFGGWISAALLTGLCALLSRFLPAFFALLLTAALTALPCALLLRRLRTHGAEEWNRL